MAEKRRFLDVWIIETNTVYREVPFTVVADWVQQGRLLENDMLRPSGTAEWFRLGGMPAFAAYLPKADPYRAEDQAEALEPVQVDFSWRRRPDEEEEDVDMIQLIDISLVLLIFFIMTTTAALSLPIKTPAAEYAWDTSNPDIIWIGINRDEDGNPTYSLGQGDKPADEADANLLAQEQLLDRLDLKLGERSAEGKGPVEVIIKAHEELPSGIVLRLTVELEKRRDMVIKKYAGVREQ